MTLRGESAKGRGRLCLDTVTVQGEQAQIAAWEVLMRYDVRSVHPEDGQMPDERPERL